MKIKIGFFAILLLLTVWFDRSWQAVATLCAAAVHEAGHLLAGALCRIRFRELRLGLFGAGFLISEQSLPTYRQEILISAAGPAVNFALAIPYLLSGSLPGNALYREFILSCLILGGVNLLPIRDFDGGRILHSLLSLLFSPRAADRILSFTSAVCIFSLWVFSVYLLLRYTRSLSLFVFACQLFFRMIQSPDAD